MMSNMYDFGYNWKFSIGKKNIESLENSKLSAISTLILKCF